MDRQLLEMSIAKTMRNEGRPLCARCLTELTADEQGVENVDVRVVMTHLGLVGAEFVFGDACGRCGAVEHVRNPILRFRTAP
jgi:hypothetical protein